MTTPSPTAPTAAPAAPVKTTPAAPAAPVRQPSFADKLMPKNGAEPKAPTPTNDAPPKGTARPDAKPGDAPKTVEQPGGPVSVKFVVDGKPVAIEMTAEEAAFIEKNPKFKERFQKSIGAERRLEQGTRLRQQAEGIIEMLKDPDAVFDHVLKHPALGHKDVRAMVEGWLMKQIELERMDPKERELMTTKEQLEDMRAREQAEKEAVKQKRNEELTKKFETDYQTDIISAVQASGLPANEETVSRTAFYIHAALTQFGKDVKAADVMPLVKQDYERMVRRLFSSSNGQTIADILGEDGLKKIRQYEIERLKNPNGSGNPAPKLPAGNQPPHASGKKPMSTDEWRDYLAKRRESGE